MLWSETSVATGIRLLTVPGPLDQCVAQSLARRIIDLAHGGWRDFVLDLSAAQEPSPNAMDPLVWVARALGSRDVRVSVVFDPALIVFQAPGLDALFDVAVTREDAVDRLARSRSA